MPLADIPDRGRIGRDSEIAPTISNCWCAVRTLRLTPPIEDGGRGSLSQSLIASLIPSYNKGWCAVRTLQVPAHKEMVGSTHPTRLNLLEDHEGQVVELFGFALKFEDLIVYGTTYCLRAFVSKADGGGL